MSPRGLEPRPRAWQDAGMDWIKAWASLAPPRGVRAREARRRGGLSELALGGHRGFERRGASIAAMREKRVVEKIAHRLLPRPGKLAVDVGAWASKTSRSRRALAWPKACM